MKDLKQFKISQESLECNHYYRIIVSHIFYKNILNFFLQCSFWIYSSFSKHFLLLALPEVIIIPCPVVPFCPTQLSNSFNRHSIVSRSVWIKILWLTKIHIMVSNVLQQKEPSLLGKMVAFRAGPGKMQGDPGGFLNI